MSVKDRTVSIVRLRSVEETPEVLETDSNTGAFSAEDWRAEQARQRELFANPPTLPVSPPPDFNALKPLTAAERVSLALRTDSDTAKDAAEKSGIKAAVGTMALAGNTILALKTPGFAEINGVALFGLALGEVVVEAGSAFYTVRNGLRCIREGLRSAALSAEVYRSGQIDTAPTSYVENNLNRQTS